MSVLYTPLATATTIPVSATVPSAVFDMGGTALGTGEVTDTDGLITLDSGTATDPVAIEFSWGLNCELNSFVRYQVVANDVVMVDGRVESADDLNGSIILTAAQVGTGVGLKLWVEDTAQDDVALLVLGSHITVNVLETEDNS